MGSVWVLLQVRVARLNDKIVMACFRPLLVLPLSDSHNILSENCPSLGLILKLSNVLLFDR
jgi:hypothetical protein